MKAQRIGLLTILGILALLLASFERAPAPAADPGPSPPSPPGKHAVFRQYDLFPGDQTLRFETGFSAPLNNLRFIMGGRPDVLIKQITGTKNNSPDIVFAGDGVPPPTVTLFFNDNPITSESSDFDIQVKNTLTAGSALEIGTIFD
jgi:hypothetical protein